jgi:hypothetical protein
MKKNAGSTMLVVLTVIATLSACVIASLNYTAVVSRNVMRSNAQRTATEVGDGALDYMFAHWREICRQQTNQQRPTADFASIPLPTTAHFPAFTNFTASTGDNPTGGTPYTVANYKIKAVDPQLGDLASTTTSPIAGVGQNWGTSSFYYLASADVTIPAFAGKPVKVNLRRVFEKRLESPWQYAIFYTDRLEIHPGPDFVVTGWVHTNERLYTAHNTLTFGSKVTYVDDWDSEFAPGDEYHTAAPADPNWPSNLPPARDTAKQPFGLDSTRIFSTSDTNPNNDSYRELVERPSAGEDPIAEARYYNQADVRILIDADNNVTIKNKSDVTVTSSSTENDKKLYDVFSSAVSVDTSSNGLIQDNREGARLRVASLDMEKIYKALTPSGTDGGTGALIGTGFKGVIYMSDTSGSATVKRGIRLKNGAKMPTGGLTVASDNPVFIQGDYNTGRTSSSETPSNANNNGTGNPIVDNYVKKPCAVLGDAVMILSNNWSDANSGTGVDNRRATPTTVNTAIVSGIVPTGLVAEGPNSYSGGAENFPRFLEDWNTSTGNKWFTYNGSMVELFLSKQNTGKWGSANVYDPPKRKWAFDPLFYTNPPPGTLTLVSYNKERWFVQ